MGEFQHHPDGYIYVRPDSGNIYADTLAHFQSDYGQPAPALPAGADEQIYTQNIRHTYKRKGMVVGGGPRAYSIGDNIIAAISSLLAAQAARPPPNVPSPPSGG
jgi:hypothetical protein